MNIRRVSTLGLPVLLAFLIPGCESNANEEPADDEDSTTGATTQSTSTTTDPGMDSTADPSSSSGTTSDASSGTTDASGTSEDATTDAESTGEGTGGSTGGQGVGIELPTSVEMSFGFNGERVAALCNFFPIDLDSTQYYLSSSLNCAPGDPYMSFRLIEDSGNYRTSPGDLVTADELQEVEFLDWSHGTLSNVPGFSTSLEQLPEATDITLETSFHQTVTFRFDGNQLTLTTFDPK